MNSNHNQHYNHSYFANNNYDNHIQHHHDYSNHQHYMNQMQQHQQQHHHRQPTTTQQNLQNYFNCNNPSRSLSVPEGLSIVSEQCTCSSNLYNTTASSASNQRLTRQRSQSLSKPMHVIEQITTSV